MNKRLLKVAVTTALTVAFAVPAFANPFSDVPAKHWAYDAVNKLAKAGVVTGYGDGTFKGDKTVSRYEMASMIATAMQKNLNNDQKEIVDQLSKEFATELNSMGVKVEALDKKVDNMVKISGDARVRYGASDSYDNTDFRARVSFDGKINDDLKFNARMTTGNMAYDGDYSGTNQTGIKLDTANVTFNALGLSNTIGRQDLVLGNGFLHDSAMTGIASQAGNLKLFAGHLKDTQKIYGAEYGMKLGAANVTADYASYDNGTVNTDIYGANVGIKLTNSVTALGEFYNTDNGTNDGTATAYGLKFNKLGLTALYRDVEANAYPGFSNLQNDMQGFDQTGFKGLEVKYDRAIAKNTTLNLKYQDFEKQDGTEIAGGARTQAAINVKF